jgi:hypothetical protein
MLKIRHIPVDISSQTAYQFKLSFGSLPRFDLKSCAVIINLNVIIRKIIVNEPGIIDNFDWPLVAAVSLASPFSDGQSFLVTLILKPQRTAARRANVLCV